jgi:phage shock protein A
LLAAEQTAKTLQQQLTSVESSVQQLQEGWKVNAAAMETNIKALNARMVML